MRRSRWRSLSDGRSADTQGRDVAKTFAKDGWQMVRQRGSHMILVKDGHMASLSVPDHREVAKGTLRGLIRAGGMTAEEFTLLVGK